jgi:zinc/manganese transport system substrate-binding protein
MKKILLILSLLNLPILAQAKVNVFACEPEWGALAREIGGDRVEVYTATTAYQDPHHIQARPSLIAKARQADLLFCSGAELEIGWLPVLLERSANPKIQPASTSNSLLVDQPGYLMAAEQVERLEVLEVVTQSMGDVHAMGNPHVQTDPRRMQQIAGVLLNRLRLIDPEGAADYRARRAAFDQQMAQFYAKNRIKIQALQDVPIVVHHNSWVYLQDWLQFNYLGSLEPQPGVPPSSGYLAKLLSALSAQPPRLILHSAYESGDAAHWLASRTGAKVIQLASSPLKDQSLLTWYQSMIDSLHAALDPR